MISNFMIFTLNGRPLFMGGKTEDRAQDLLISGFLSAFQIFAGNLHQTKINKIELEDYTYFYSVQDPVISVLEAKPESELQSNFYQVIAERLAQKFIQMFPKELICHWDGEDAMFESFREPFNQISQEILSLMKKSDQKLISDYFIQAAKDENIRGMVVFNLEKDEIEASNIPEDIAEKDFEAFGSMLFSFVKRLAITLKAGEINEILIRAKKYWIGGFRQGHFAVFMLFAYNYFGQMIPEFVKKPIL